jgi:basic membrane protein A
MSVVLSACGPEKVGGFEIPNVEKGKFNVAMVLIGPHDDGGWSQAHYEGLLYVEENVPNTHVAYIENVPEGADSEQVFRALSRKGFDLILGTSYGFMDPMEAVAAEYPDIMYVHISGIKSNGTNFGNLFGAMEVMKYFGGIYRCTLQQTESETWLHGNFPIRKNTSW